MHLASIVVVVPDIAEGAYRGIEEVGHDTSWVDPVVQWPSSYPGDAFDIGDELRIAEDSHPSLQLGVNLTQHSEEEVLLTQEQRQGPFMSCFALQLQFELLGQVDSVHLVHPYFDDILHVPAADNFHVLGRAEVRHRHDQRLRLGVMNCRLTYYYYCSLFVSRRCNILF